MKTPNCWTLVARRSAKGALRFLALAGLMSVAVAFLAVAEGLLLWWADLATGQISRRFSARSWA